jgi:hypothetical protein
MTEQKPERELLDRLRRMETKLTKIGNHLNVDVGGATPAWDPDRKRLIIDSPNCSLGDIFKAIPLQVSGSALVPVHIGEQFYMSVRLDR